jgi:hypothetical protein
MYPSSCSTKALYTYTLYQYTYNMYVCVYVCVYKSPVNVLIDLSIDRDR